VIEIPEAAPAGSDVASLFPTSNSAPQAEVTKPVILTIAEAKRGLAANFGVKPEAIEITIRA
jgi:hypothetical protein